MLSLITGLLITDYWLLAFTLNLQPGTENMHSNEIKDKFVELRATGKSFGEIAEKLNVAKSTLHPWEDERAGDIARLRRIQWEETEKSLGRRLEDDLETLAARLLDWEGLMIDVNLNGNHSLRDILLVLRETRREYRHLRAMLMGAPQRRKNSVEPAPEATGAKPNKTERFQENGTTGPRHTNDLQQLESNSFGFPGARPSSVAAPLDSTTIDTDPATTSLPSGSEAAHPV